jgi:hypothetical protein
MATETVTAMEKEKDKETGMTTGDPHRHLPEWTA